MSAALLAAALTACAHAVHPYPVSSESSDYSPAVQLWTRIARHDAVVDVFVDSGTVIEPGAALPGSPALMAGLTLEALAVVAPSETSTRTTQPWQILAESAPAPLADSLLMGVRQSVAATRFRIVLPRSADASRSWLVYRIRGNSVNPKVRLADGTVINSSLGRNSIHVFACADRNLDGRIDAPRASALAKAYSTRC